MKTKKGEASKKTHTLSLFLSTLLTANKTTPKDVGGHLLEAFSENDYESIFIYLFIYFSINH